MLERAKTGALIALAVALAVLAYLHFLPAKAPVGVQIEAAPAPEVAKVEKVPVECKTVMVYPAKAKGKLKLPPSVQSDPGKHVISSTRTPDDERQHTVTTVLDTSTGESTTFDRAEPLPWLAPNTTSDVGVFVGYKNAEQAIRIEGRQELLRVKALHLGAVGGADITPGGIDGFVGVGAWARW